VGHVEEVMPTPLQLYAGVLADRRGCAAPATAGAHVLRAWVRGQSDSPREREIARYLISAADGHLGHDGGNSTLKHVLWWLREYAGKEYAHTARHVLQHLIQHPEVDLAEMVRHLPQIPSLAPYARRIARGADGDMLKAFLEMRRVGDWFVAINLTCRNLLGIAMQRTECDLYVAASARGAVLKARREVAFPMTEAIAELNRLMGKWVQPYSDYALRERDPERPADLDTILAVVERMPAIGYVSLSMSA
jgi:hypothetical protein